MSGRALLLDVGNTYLKWGVLDHDRIARTGKVSHRKLGGAAFSSLATRLPRRVDEVLICNVAGQELATRLSAFIGIHCGVEAHFAQSKRRGYGVTNGYQRARRLGVDRWVAMIGARAEFNSALCVVDAGSAITIDALDKEGVHLGGQIIPGLHLMARSLHSNTSGINEMRSRLADPGAGMAHFADSTGRAIQAGALNAICGAIERAVRTMRAEGFRPRVVLTGGSAAPILTQIGGRVVHRPHLVLEGLATMLRNPS
jgi:type III pantothenate kinase